MNCKKCDMEIVEGALFCHNCGTKAEAVCVKCCRKLIEGALFCAYCGASVTGDRRTEEKTLKKETSSGVGSKPKDTKSYSPADKDLFANDKSVYIGSAYGRDYSRIVFDEMIYFISSSDDRKIYKTDKYGTDPELVVARHDDDYNHFIGVNKRGIFTYDSYESPYVYHYSFQGDLLNCVRLMVSDGGYLKDISIFDDKINYIASDETINPVESLRVIDIDGNNPKDIYSVSPSYDTIEQINRVQASKDYIVFEVHFRDIESCKGWYLYEYKTESLTFLNSRMILPEEVISNPEKFDFDDPEYIDDPDSFEIFGFDLQSNIMWTLASIRESKKMSISKEECRTILFQRRIKPGRKYPIIKDSHTWKLPDWHSMSDEFIFDGNYMLHIPRYFEIYGVKPDGTKSDNWNGSGHGRCNELQLTGGILIGDILADYKDYWYPLQFDKPESLYKNELNWKTK